MLDVPAAPNEGARLAALHDYRLLDMDAEPAFDAFVALAAAACEAPIAFVAFVDGERQRLTATRGLPDVADLDRDALCAHALHAEGVFEVADATHDARFADAAIVARPPHVRFYAAIALVDRDGHALGTLSVADPRPRELDARQRDVLHALAASLVVLVESRRGVEASTLAKLSLIGAAIEHAPEPIAILARLERGDRFHFTYVNHAFAQLFEYDATAFVGHRATMLYGPLTDVDEIGRMRRALRTDSVATLVVAFYTARGARLTVELNVHRIDDVHWVMNARDLTQINEARDALTTSNERLSSLLGSNSDAVLTLERDGRCVDANPAAVALFGRPRDALLEMDAVARVADEVRGDGDALFERLRSGETICFESSFAVDGGRTMVAECRGVPMVVRGVVAGAYLILRDVSEERRLERLLQSHARRTRALYMLCADNDGDELAHVDAALSLVREAFEMDFAYVGRLDGDRLVVSTIVGDPFFAVDDAFAIAGTFVEGTLRGTEVEAIGDLSTVLSRAPNSPFARGWHGYISAPLWVEGRQWGAVTFLARHPVAFDEFDLDFTRLVTALVASMLERISQRERLDRLAFFDALTELPNRTSFLRELDEALACGARTGSSFALHYVDLDGFKAINDGAGHAAGDLALQEVARRLRAVARLSDVPGRIGGDEFVLIQREVASARDAERVAGRIVTELGEPYDVDGRRETRLGASVGFAVYPNDGVDAASLVRAADAALYRAKAAGKRRAERA